MPELPEVETIKNQIARVLPLKVDAIAFSKESQSIVKTKDYPLIGLTILKVMRQGKILRFVLNDQKKIISGLGMSGAWRISDVPLLEKHVHIQIISRFKGRDLYLSYVDPRRFGVLHFFSKENEAKWLTRLGVDVSGPHFNLEYLLDLKKRFSKKKIKPFLLEQKYFAGVGNYMASEICARSFIRPTRRMQTLTKNDLKRIIASCQFVLEGAIHTGGTTFAGGYVDTLGNKGEGVLGLVVFYQKKCGQCRAAPIKKIIMAQRGTYYCPRCQK